MIETVALSVTVTQVKPAREVEKAGQYIFSHRPTVGKTARGGHDNIRTPQVGVEEIAGSGWQLMNPFQSRRASADVFDRRPADEHDFR